jgi:predicted phage terminase large subunit-like protein
LSPSKVECAECAKETLASTLRDGLCMACAIKKDRVTPSPKELQAERRVIRKLGRGLLDMETDDALMAVGMQRYLENAAHEADQAEARVEAPLPPPPVEDSDSTKTQKVALQELARRILAKRHLLPFVMRFKPDYKAGWVHKIICAELERFSKDVAAGLSPRLIIEMPPRHGKSEVVSVNFPAWHLGHYPTHEVIAASHTAQLAVTFSRRVRSLLRDASYHSLFEETRLSDDTQSAEQWRTTQGGGEAAVGVGSAVVGKGAHVLIIDDPYKGLEDADSFKTRQSVLEWYQTEAFTRLAPGGGVLVIMQRWHDDDLAGWLINHGKATGYPFRVLHFPALAEIDEPHRKAGEPLHAARYPIELLEQIKAVMTPRQWSAVYQQNPVPDEGAYFDKSWFRYYTQLPAEHNLVYVDGWDLAIAEGEDNDYTVGVTVAMDRERNFYITDLSRKRQTAKTSMESLIDTHIKHKSVFVAIGKDQMQMTMESFMIEELKRRDDHVLSVDRPGIRGNVISVPTGRRDKEARARPIQGLLESGRLFLPASASWTKTVEHELLRFPGGEHDDIVDALSVIGHIIGRIYEAAALQKPKKKSWRDTLDQFTGGSKAPTHSLMSG